MTSDHQARRQKFWRDVAWIAIIPALLYLLASLMTYSSHDPGWSQTGSLTAPLHNVGGQVGAWLADVLLLLFGRVAFLLPVMLAGIAWIGLASFTHLHVAHASYLGPALRLAGSVGFVIAASGLAHIRWFQGDVSLAGGIIGKAIIASLEPSFGALGANLFAIVLLLLSTTLATGLSWFTVMEAIGRFLLGLIRRWQQRRLPQDTWRPTLRPPKPVTAIVVDESRPVSRASLNMTPPGPRQADQSERRPVRSAIAVSAAVGENAHLPSVALLDEPKPQTQGYDEQTLENLSRQIEVKLKDFRIDAQVVGAYPGPVITRFEIELAPGVKVSQISSLDKDIARGLSVKSVRVVDVIPGKSVIGLEIPNLHREMIFLVELLRSKEYEAAASPLTLALGKDIAGRPLVADLARMPHLLVAGTTGSGKSVAVNAMVLSLLYKSSHQDLRMLMIDPKMLELSVYQGIPHLIAPVVTDMKEAANGLRWCVAEMERRYKLMSAVGVRNLAGFNKKVNEANATGQPLFDPSIKPNPESNEAAPPLEPLPFIVIFIDEFADMMMIVGKKVEELIARLAQKARAAGIHLILATQRPSVDVITGLIKANIPSRIAFQVSSKIDSRTILDQSGAETLLGHGDMLYLPPGTAIPERVHGAFVSDEEVHRIVEHLRTPDTSHYISGVLDEVQQLGNGVIVGATGLPETANVSVDESDPLYDEAIRIVTQTRRASISGVQRRLKIGYNRAARLVEAMEFAGVVSPPEHNGERTVLAPPPPSED